MLPQVPFVVSVTVIFQKGDPLFIIFEFFHPVFPRAFCPVWVSGRVRWVCLSTHPYLPTHTRTGTDVYNYVVVSSVRTFVRTSDIRTDDVRPYTDGRDNNVRPYLGEVRTDDVRPYVPIYSFRFKYSF